VQQADRRIDRGGEIAIGEGHPDHHAPLTVEHVAEAHTVPIRGELLVLVEVGISPGTADPIDVLVGMPVLEENPAAVIVLLGQHAAADVEHAAPAGAGARRGGGQAEQRHHRHDERGQERDEGAGASPGRMAVRRRLRGHGGGRHGGTDRVCAPQRSRTTARLQAGDEGESRCDLEHDRAVRI
jgi:hypothetical protein